MIPAQTTANELAARLLAACCCVGPCNCDPAAICLPEGGDLTNFIYSFCGKKASLFISAPDILTTFEGDIFGGGGGITALLGGEPTPPCFGGVDGDGNAIPGVPIIASFTNLPLEIDKSYRYGASDGFTYQCILSAYQSVPFCGGVLTFGLAIGFITNQDYTRPLLNLTGNAPAGFGVGLRLLYYDPRLVGSTPPEVVYPSSRAYYPEPNGMYTQGWKRKTTPDMVDPGGYATVTLEAEDPCFACPLSRSGTFEGFVVNDGYPDPSTYAEFGRPKISWSFSIDCDKKPFFPG